MQILPQRLWRKHSPGFTIVELLIVVVVIAILAAISIVAYNGIQNRAKMSSAQSSASQASKKIATYAVTNNEVLPLDLVAAGVTDTGSTTYNYAYDSTPNPGIYCVSTTIGTYSYAVTSKTGGNPILGECVNNRILNPSFELNTTNWTNAGTAGAVLTRVTTEFYSGAASLQVATNGAAVNQGAFTSGRASVLPNTTYTASVWIKGDVGRTIRIELGELDSVGTLIGSRSLSTIITGNGAWQRHTVTKTTGATAASADIVVRNVTIAAHTFFIDGAMISEGTDQLAFGDGNSAGWSWSGTPNGTTSLGPVTFSP